MRGCGVRGGGGTTLRTTDTRDSAVCHPPNPLTDPHRCIGSSSGGMNSLKEHCSTWTRVTFRTYFCPSLEDDTRKQPGPPRGGRLGSVHSNPRGSRPGRRGGMGPPLEERPLVLPAKSGRHHPIHARGLSICLVYHGVCTLLRAMPQAGGAYCIGGALEAGTLPWSPTSLVLSCRRVK